MGNYVIKLKDRYFLWSTIVDAPISSGRTYSDMINYLIKWHAHRKSDAEARLMRAEMSGTSALDGHTVDDLISNNRAGYDEECLTADEIYEEYKK